MIEVALAWLPRLATAAAPTVGLAVAISAITAALALSLYGREAPRVRAAIEAFSAFFRAIPELVVLFFFYFGATQVGLDLGAIGSTIVASP